MTTLQSPHIQIKPKRKLSSWIIAGAFLLWGALAVLVVVFVYRHFGYGWDLGQGEQLYRQKRYAEAKERFLAARRLVETAKVDVDAALCAFHTKDKWEAEKLFRAAIRLQPHWSYPYAQLGSMYLAEHRLNEGEPVLRKAIALVPQDPINCANLGLLFLYRHDYAQSVQYLQKAIHLNANESRVYVWLGSAYVGLGKVKEAETAYRRGLELNPYDGYPYFCLAKLAEARNNYSDASTLLNRGLAVDSSATYIRAELNHISSKKDPFGP